MSPCLGECAGLTGCRWPSSLSPLRPLSPTQGWTERFLSTSAWLSNPPAVATTLNPPTRRCSSKSRFDPVGPAFGISTCPSCLTPTCTQSRVCRARRALLSPGCLHSSSGATSLSRASVHHQLRPLLGSQALQSQGLQRRADITQMPQEELLGICCQLCRDLVCMRWSF